MKFACVLRRSCSPDRLQSSGDRNDTWESQDSQSVPKLLFNVRRETERGARRTTASLPEARSERPKRPVSLALACTAFAPDACRPVASALAWGSCSCPHPHLMSIIADDDCSTPFDLCPARKPIHHWDPSRLVTRVQSPRKNLTCPGSQACSRLRSLPRLSHPVRSRSETSPADPALKETSTADADRSR